MLVSAIVYFVRRYLAPQLVAAYGLFQHLWTTVFMGRVVGLLAVTIFVKFFIATLPVGFVVLLPFV